MPRDRLKDLSSSANKDSEEVASLGGEVSPILQRIEKLRSKAAELENTQAEYLADGDKRKAKHIEELIAAIHKESELTRQNIMKFNERTVEMARDRSANASVIDIRRNQFKSLARKLSEVTKESYELQKDHQANVTKQVSKRLQVRFSNDDGQSSISESDADLFARKLVETGHEDEMFVLAREELEKAMATKEAVKELEREMRELYVMFTDLHELVMHQGEGVTAMADSVDKAATSLEKGNRDLKRAKEYQKSCCSVA
jgi:t-SNARE complex subunit (syntaxin)